MASLARLFYLEVIYRLKTSHFNQVSYFTSRNRAGYNTGFCPSCHSTLFLIYILRVKNDPSTFGLWSIRTRHIVSMLLDACLLITLSNIRIRVVKPAFKK